MSFWMIGRQMVIFIAGLGNIPVQLQEAAQIDGASKFTSILKITVPLMTPLIFYNMIIAIINSFQTFVPALIMTDGGPENSTLFVVLNIYRNGFQFFNMGYASALAWELFIIVIGLTIVAVLRVEPLGVLRVVGAPHGHPCHANGRDRKIRGRQIAAQDDGPAGHHRPAGPDDADPAHVPGPHAVDGLFVAEEPARDLRQPDRVDPGRAPVAQLRRRDGSCCPSPRLRSTPSRSPS